MSASQHLSAALTTPFLEDGGLDMERLVSHARWCLANGCQSVTLFGTTGEGASVHRNEQDRVLSCLRDVGVDLRAAVMGCVAEDSVEGATGRLRALYDADCRGALLCPPHYYKDVSDAGLLDWFGAVFARLEGGARDVILYHIPAVTGVGLSADMISRLRDAWPGVVTGIKDSSGDPRGAREFLARHGDLQVLIGDERLLAEAIRQGAKGSISGLANVVPGELEVLIRSGTESQRVSALVDAVMEHPVVPAVKALVACRTGEPAWLRVRPPLAALGARAASRLNELMEPAGTRAGR